jgi:hypothetical protein
MNPIPSTIALVVSTAVVNQFNGGLNLPDSEDDNGFEINNQISN